MNMQDNFTGGKRICRVCGKEYPYCKTNVSKTVFRWQNIACCPEHASIYFENARRLREEREEKKEPQTLEVTEPADIGKADEAIEAEEVAPKKKTRKRKSKNTDDAEK